MKKIVFFLFLFSIFASTTHSQTEAGGLCSQLSSEVERITQFKSFKQIEEKAEVDFTPDSLYSSYAEQYSDAYCQVKASFENATSRVFSLAQNKYCKRITDKDTRVNWDNCCPVSFGEYMKEDARLYEERKITTQEENNKLYDELDKQFSCVKTNTPPPLKGICNQFAENMPTIANFSGFRKFVSAEEGEFTPDSLNSEYSSKYSDTYCKVDYIYESGPDVFSLAPDKYCLRSTINDTVSDRCCPVSFTEYYNEWLKVDQKNVTPEDTEKLREKLYKKFDCVTTKTQPSVVPKPSVKKKQKAVVAADEEEEATEERTPGKPGLHWIGLVVFLALVGGGVFAYLKLHKKTPRPAKQEQQPTPAEPPNTYQKEAKDTNLKVADKKKK